jgi:simple sugar transport system ATP-binding protein
MSGGEKQCLAIARAIHFGASVLILDEPTAALGVKQSCNVLKLINRARERGISVIFITHNVHHAYPIGDSFTLLNRGRSMGTFTRKTITKDEMLDLMAGGEEMHKLSQDLAGVAI